MGDPPEPGRVVKHAVGALRPGGIFVSYLPSIMQVSQLREAMDAAGFLLPSTVEVLQRSWHVEGHAVRPDHRMVAHTGFLTSARRPADPPEACGHYPREAMSEAIAYTTPEESLAAAETPEANLERVVRRVCARSARRGRHPLMPAPPVCPRRPVAPPDASPRVKRSRA